MNSGTSRSLVRLLLRSLPVVPGPELYDLIQDLQRSRPSIDQKINEAFQSLQQASQLVADLERELQERTQKLTQLRDEVDRYSKLAEVEESRATAIIRQLELTLNRDRGRERWVSFGINMVAGLILFVLGVVFGPQLTSLLKITQP
jgi:predicted RNase H-like nuclease (RuvC/YqgF family)